MIEYIFILTALVLLVLHGCIYYYVWNGMNGPQEQNSEEEQSFSIIIAARNEELHLPRCLASIGHIKYPASKFETIVVDDRSTDATAAIVRKAAQQHSTISLVTIESNASDMPHKKNALAAGIQAAHFPILVFTDADCIVPPEWLQNISREYSDTVGAVAGYSPSDLEHTSFLARMFLHYEELKNSIIAYSGVRRKRAFMCTGRNFSYRRNVYDELGGFEKIKHSVSGDDDLFLQLIQKETRWEIRYIPSLRSAVITSPPASLQQFVRQRIRHISASKFYSPGIQLFFSISHVLTIILLVGFFVAPLPMLILFLAKINIDGLIVAKGTPLFEEKVSIIEFFIGEILIPIYHLIIGPLGLFVPFGWKEKQVP